MASKYPFAHSPAKITYCSTNVAMFIIGLCWFICVWLCLVVFGSLNWLDLVNFVGFHRPVYLDDWDLQTPTNEGTTQPPINTESPYLNDTDIAAARSAARASKSHFISSF